MERCVHCLLMAIVPIVVSGSLNLHAQQQNTGDAPIKLRTELVVLDAQVIRKSTGEVVSGLTKNDFAIYEDGVKQQITNFSQDKLPLSLLLLLDVSGSVQPVIDQVRDQGAQVLGRLRPDDEVAVMVFGKWATVTQDFTRDRRLIIKRIGYIAGMGPWIREATYIDQAVYQAAKYLGKSANPNSRKIIIVITDNQSNQPLGISQSEGDALEALIESDAALCGLVVGDFAGAVEHYKRQGLILKDSIGNYVSDTGGLVLPVERSDAVEKLAGMIERLRTRYSFGYIPANTKRDGKFRTLKLTIAPAVEKREGRITIITRKGYRVPKDEPNSAGPVPKP